MRRCGICHLPGHDRRSHTRHNPTGAGYIAGGVFHPIRSWSGYDPAKLTAAEGKRTKAKRTAERVAYRVEHKAERSAKARELLEKRAASRKSTKTIHIRSNDRMSNTQWNKWSRPHWWARYVKDGKNHFVETAKGSTRWRGDTNMEFTAEVPRDVATVYIGVGPDNRYGIREAHKV